MASRIPFRKNPCPVSARKVYESQRCRKEAHEFYNGQRWQDTRLAYLAANPLCEDCLKTGKVVPGKAVHHIIERVDAPELAYDWDNLESTCNACHNKKRTKKLGENKPDPRGA